MITDDKKWHDLSVKSSNFYCLNCFHSYSIKNKLKEHERVCNDHDNCYVEMSNEDNKILKYNHGEKAMKVPAIIYADLECLLKKMHSCQNNPEKSYVEKKLCIMLLVIQCLQIVYLIQQKTNLIVIE